MGKNYMHISSEEKDKLAKEIAKTLLCERIDQYQFIKAPEEEVKNRIQCKTTHKTVYGGCEGNGVLLLSIGKNLGYEGLDTRVHEILDAVLGDEKLFDGQFDDKPNKFTISHKRTHELAAEAVRRYRKGQQPSQTP